MFRAKTCKMCVAQLCQKFWACHLHGLSAWPSRGVTRVGVRMINSNSLHQRNSSPVQRTPQNQDQAPVLCGNTFNNRHDVKRFRSNTNGRGLASFPNIFSGSSRNDIQFTKVVSDAEKLVGYPTSFMSLRCLLSDEMSNIAMYVRKLVGTKHPLLKTARGLVLEGKHAVQTRGLIVLLVSKAAGPTVKEDHTLVEDDVISGIYNSQRQLAEITELIHTANLIHQGVVNLKDVQPSDGPLKDMEVGNKIAILSGDFLLANACTGLAQLRNTKVVEMISSAIGDMMEAEFVHVDKSNQPLPAPLSMDQWDEHCYLSRGALIANSCRSAMELADHTEEMQLKAAEFGKQIAYTQKLHEELQPYINPDSDGELSLTSAPSIMYLQDNKDINPSDLLDEKRLYHAILSSSSTLNKVQQLCQDHGRKAVDALQIFRQSDARTALEKLTQAFTTFPRR